MGKHRDNNSHQSGSKRVPADGLTVARRTARAMRENEQRRAAEEAIRKAERQKKYGQ
jgi:hypothetical protein